MKSNFPFVFSLERGELGAAGAVLASPEEPRFYYIGERGRGDVAVQNLLRVVPAHPSTGHAAAD